MKSNRAVNFQVNYYMDSFKKTLSQLDYLFDVYKYTTSYKLIMLFAAVKAIEMKTF